MNKTQGRHFRDRDDRPLVFDVTEEIKRGLERKKIQHEYHDMRAPFCGYCLLEVLKKLALDKGKEAGYGREEKESNPY